jgi:hypothetical protein
LTPHAHIVARQAEDAAAVAREVNFAAAVYRRYFEALPPRGEVWVLDSPDDAGAFEEADSGGFAWRYPVPNRKYLRHALRKSSKQGGSSRSLDELVDRITGVNLVAHETGHLFLYKWVEQHRTDKRGRKPGYASSLPDWMDEAFVIRCETGASRQERVRYYVRHCKPIPLATLLTMEHPSPENASNAPNPGGIDARVVTGDHPAHAYYGVCSAFMTYLEERGEPALFREWALSSLKGLSNQTFLANQKALPKTVGALQADFDKWIKKQNLLKPCPSQ